MVVTLGKAVELLNLSSRSMPTCRREEDLLVSLVRTWLIQHGEAWVRSNLRLEDEWQRHRTTLWSQPESGDKEAIPPAAARV